MHQHIDSLGPVRHAQARRRAGCRGVIGPILYTVDRQTLEAEGALTVAQVTILRIGEPDSMLQSIADEAKPKIETMFGRMKWTIAAKGENPAELYKIAERRVVFALVLKQIIVENQARQYEIARLATRHIADGDSVLIIVYAIEQGRDLMARIPGARLVFSGMTVKADGRRSDLIQAFKDGVCRCLIATSLADEGLDCPRANVLILAAGGRSTAKSEQRTGRVLRTFAGKTHGVIYDFLDLDHPMASAQSWQRFKTYKKLGYAIQFETVIPA
jgi:superfamily II DNA or RNA helicase